MEIWAWTHPRGRQAHTLRRELRLEDLTRVQRLDASAVSTPLRVQGLQGVRHLAFVHPDDLLGFEPDIAQVCDEGPRVEAASPACGLSCTLGSSAPSTSLPWRLSMRFTNSFEVVLTRSASSARSI